MRRDANTPQPISRVFIDEAFACARSAGITIHTLLESCGLSDQDLDALTADRFGAIWLAISTAMDDEYFGLGKRPMRPGSMTLMGHAVRGAPNFEVALGRALRFLKMVLEKPFGRLERSGAECSIVLAKDDKPRSAFAYRTYFLILHGLNCWLVGERIPLRLVEFPCQEPKGSNDYRDYFGTPVQFGAAEARVTFDARYLTRTVRRSEAELKAFLRTTPSSLLQGYRDEKTLKQRIIDECFAGVPANWPNSEQVAKTLGMSRASLHRALRERGQNLTLIKEELLRRRALALLKETGRPIVQIAADLGYAEQSAFYRAFHRWFGRPPGAFRDAMNRET